MKKNVLIAFVLVSSLSFGQKLKVKSGSFDFLKGQSEVNVAFVYDNLQLLKKNLSDEEYVSEHKAEIEEKKGKASADAWAKSWYASRELIFAPKFLELMNRFEGDHGLQFAENLDSAQYTLIVDVVWIFPGWDAGVMKQPAKVTTLLRFVETANKDNVLLEIESKDAPGDQWGSSFSNENRIGEGFAKTGKSFARLLTKELK